MKYLFYDLELSFSLYSQTRICEFGYVLTDDGFNIIDSGNLYINPKQREKTWKKQRKNFNLYSKDPKFYTSQPYLPTYDSKIRSLFKKSDIVIGWSIRNDVKSLNNELVRYSLKPIDFKFLDAERVYQCYKKLPYASKLSNACVELKLESLKPDHNAYVDAYNTMLVFKEIINQSKLSISDIGKQYPLSVDWNKNYWTCKEYEAFSRLVDEFRFNLNGENNNQAHGGSINSKRFQEFALNVKKTSDISNIFDGKYVSISNQYCKSHFNQSLNLIQLIVNNGGLYTQELTEANIVVKGIEISDKYIEFENQFIEKANNANNKPQIIEFDQLLDMLNINKDTLDKMDRPSFEFLFDDDTKYLNYKEYKAIMFILACEELNIDWFDIDNNMLEILKMIN